MLYSENKESFSTDSNLKTFKFKLASILRLINFPFIVSNEILNAFYTAMRTGDLMTFSLKTYSIYNSKNNTAKLL